MIRFLIANAYAGGGTIRTTLNMANELSARHDVEVASAYGYRKQPTYDVDPAVRMRPLVDTRARRDERGGGPLARAGRRAERWASDQGSRLIHPQDTRYPKFSVLTDVQLMRYLRSVRGGVIVSTRPGLNLAVARYVRRSVVRIGQEHLYLARHRPGLREAIQRHYPRLDAVTALTEGDAKAYGELLGDDARVLCMPNAMPDIGDARAALDNRVVIAAGRLMWQKGFDQLIKAFVPVAAKHPDWHLRIFGAGERRGELQQQIDKLDVGGNVSLMGFTTRLPQEMADASIYAMSSRFEGFPMVMLEAMGCGLPIVSFDFPTGARDLVSHGTDGLLIANRDIDGLAAGIIDLIENPARRKAFGAAALDKVARYQTPTMAKRWEELFTDLAAAKSTRR